MQKLQLAMSLRRRLRDRFHTRGVDTADYTKWIAKVETDTRQLADALLSMLYRVFSSRSTTCTAPILVWLLSGAPSEPSVPSVPAQVVRVDSLGSTSC